MAFCSRCGVSIEGRFCATCGYDNQPHDGAQNLSGSIDQLYSLRAGISLVSMQIDDINKEKNKGNEKISKYEKTISNLDVKLRNNIQASKSCYNEVINCQNKIALAKENEQNGKVKELEAQKENQRKELEAEQRKLKSKNTILGVLRFFVYAVCGIFAIGAAGGGFGFLFGLLSYAAIELFRISKLKSIASFLDGPFAVIVLVVFVVCAAITVLTFLLAKKLTGKMVKIDVEKELSHWDSQIESCKNIISQGKACETNIVTLENEIIALKQGKRELENQSDLEKTALAEFKKSHKAEIDYYQLCSNETYNALVKEYSPLIDVRDWQNLDLVIYYLETGRAISVREALQLVDRQHQTEAIIQTFKVATEQIKETITMNTQRLETTIVGCTNVIGSRLDDVRGRLNAIEVNQEVATSHIRNLSSQISVSNALQAKANTTSEKMMQDIRQMRINSDNAAIKARNS